MEYIFKIHSNFLRDIITSSKLDDNSYSMIPTVSFLASSFVFLYCQLHRYTSQLTRWQTRFYRDMVFHWSFFYLTKVWFLFVKFCRWTVSALDEILETNLPKQELQINKMLIHISIFFIVCFVGIIPLLLLSLRHIYTRSIPNFLMWVGEDPWLRSEIGVSGHYLERPARVPLSRRKNSAYRSRRSTSVDSDLSKQHHKNYMRNCKSMLNVNVIRSVNDVVI